MKAGSPEYQRARYAKFREKRLAEKREDYWSDPEKLRARNRAQYAANREKRIEYARQYRERKREEILAKKAEYWLANRDLIKERRKGHNVNEEARKAYVKEWLRRNPDKAILQAAKNLLSEQLGIAIREVPQDLAEAKAEHLKLVRWIRDAVAQGIETGTAETERLSPKGESPADVQLELELAA